ncbi:MAG TPA: DNRLRE domain-containing protein [Gemmatimonadota bacterium]|nr:DNRLRE domain-containing protein [Gemmatimonadota bacterium]
MRAFRIAALPLLLVSFIGCTDDSRSPVGVDLLPGGILEGGLQVITLTTLDRAEDFEVFPAGRGTADRLVTARSWPEEPGIESRALVRFSLSSLDTLPEGAEIVGAGIRLVFVPVDQPITFHLHVITDFWSEEAATWERRDFGEPWTTPGGDFEAAPVATFTIQPTAPDTARADSVAFADSVRVSLPASLVEAWRSETTLNAGLILIQETPGEAVAFPSAAGLNPLGPRLDVDVLLEDPGSLAFVQRIQAEEDTFIVDDPGSLPPGGLAVSAGDPLRRTFLVHSLEGVPPGATVVEAQLIVSPDGVRIPGDSLFLSLNQVLGEFREENTILGTTLGVVSLAAGEAPDSLVFQSGALTSRVRQWLRDPESNEGVILSVQDEDTAFGEVRLFGPDAAILLRPRIRLVLFPPPLPS